MPVISLKPEAGRLQNVDNVCQAAELKLPTQLGYAKEKASPKTSRSNDFLAGQRPTNGWGRASSSLARSPRSPSTSPSKLGDGTSPGVAVGAAEKLRCKTTSENRAVAESKTEEGELRREGSSEPKPRRAGMACEGNITYMRIDATGDRQRQASFRLSADSHARPEEAGSGPALGMGQTREVQSQATQRYTASGPRPGAVSRSSDGCPLSPKPVLAWSRLDKIPSKEAVPADGQAAKSQHVSFGPLSQCDFAYTTIFSRLFESVFEPQNRGPVPLPPSDRERDARQMRQRGVE
ncbi:hypothetical protein CMUS01_04230 [Colletotrichum musicola]|uniref:Uncharacterized protein n=1 Tax=Colletotrichum musicola TaxID=2175873 RepID=A0A8H6KY98_9PEZI|nr:hypothetical protein CMUS01_04230 [Colletotrichum musicola]